jgi:PAS domain S-box-containing protein
MPQTSRPLLETELTAANALLHLALEAGKAVAWDWDVKSGRDCWFGDLQTIFGMPSGTFSGHVQDFRQRVHAEDRERVWKATKAAMADRVPYVAEFRVVRDDGIVRWVAARGQFYYSPEGEPQRMLGIAVDVTDRRVAEEALQRKDSELAEAQRLARVGSWQWDAETDTVAWSDEIYRITGRDPRLPAVSYRDHGQLYTPESWNRLRHAVEEALRSGAAYELDLEVVRADGATRWVMAHGEAQRDAAGRIVGLRGTLHDFTERKLAEEALSNLSRRLIEAQEAERARIARELHDDVAQRLALTLIALDQRGPRSHGDVLDPADIELRRQIEDISMRVHDLSHELHSATLYHLGMSTAMRRLCEELSDRHKVDIEFSVNDIPAVIQPDVSLCLFRVLQEALHNAVKHSTVRHFGVELFGQSDSITLTVRDAGVGFDPSKALTGRGLGLISMQERLKLVNGQLSIDSQHEKGTAVCARVPIAAAGLAEEAVV